MAGAIYESFPGTNEMRRKQKDPHLAKKRNYALFRVAGAATAIKGVADLHLYPNYICAEAFDLLKQLDHLRDKMSKVGRGEEHKQYWPE